MALKVFAFDAYGTLFDVHSAVRSHAQAVGPQADALSALWRVKQLEYSWVRTLMSRYVDFWSCTVDALDFALRAHGLPADGLKDSLLQAYRRLEAYPDVRPALENLRRRGVSTAILSNGSPDMLRDAVQSAGLDDLLDASLSVDEVKHFKTHPSTYAMVTALFGVTPAEVSFQSSNAWDIAGGAVFGFRCVRVDRAGGPAEYEDVVQPMVVRDLRELVAHHPSAGS